MSYNWCYTHHPFEGIDAVENGYFDNLSRYNENKSSILFIPNGYAGILVML